MGADVILHIIDGVFTPEEIEMWFSDTIGSKYCPLTHITGESTEAEVAAAFEKCRCAAGGADCEAMYDRWLATEQIGIGECSFLKASLFGDSDAYIPPLVDVITGVVGPDDVIITDEIIEKFRAWEEPHNDTGYETNKRSDVLAFLETHRGKRAVCVGW